MPKVLITGCAGMIGFHLAKELATCGHEVIGWDNFNAYYSVQLKRRRADLLLSGCGIKMTEIDITKSLIEEAGLLERVDLIIHLAAYANPRHSERDPYPYIDTNIKGTQRVIDLAELLCIPVIYASSSCVMHDQALPWKEDDRPAHQNNAYGWSKRVNECQFLNSKVSRSIGLRFFTVYGPLGRPDMATWQFVENITSGKSISVFGNGLLKRDFTYVTDIVAGIVLCVRDILNTQNSYHEIFNIGRGEQILLRDYVSLIEEATGIAANIKFMPKPHCDVEETWADISKIRKLGYHPKVSAREGVHKFVEWYLSEYKTRGWAA